MIFAGWLSRPSRRVARGLATLFTLLLVAGCGGSSNDSFVFTGTPNNNNNNNNNNNTTGALTFNFVTAQALPVPAGTDTLRFLFFSNSDATGNQIQEEIRDFAASITIDDVRIDAKSVVITAYDVDGLPTVQFTVPVNVAPDETTTVNVSGINPTQVTFETITVSPGSQTIAVGATFQYNASLTFSSGDVVVANSVVDWVATGAAASVSDTGLATGNSFGTATITATYAGESDSASLTVGTGEGPAATLQGTITFEKIVPTANFGQDDFEANGQTFLDFANPVSAPVRFAVVQALDSQDNILVQSNTSASGAYTLAVPAGAGQIKVRVLAQTVGVTGQSAPIRVQDNTDSDALYAVDSEFLNRADATVDIDIPSGYGADGSQAQGVVRSSGPFACLDGVLTGYRYFLSGGVNASELPLCVVNWSELNRPESGDLADGEIGTSFFSSELNEMFILGDRAVDTDEFDWHVMVHEFGHWVQSNRYRDDSPGGSHSLGSVTDPRLAFSEGFGNAIGGLALADAVYKDTLAPSGFAFSMEVNGAGFGWASEASVMAILFDLFDPVRQEGGDSNFNDQLALPVSAFTAALDFQSGSSALTTVFSFLEGLTDNGLSGGESTALTALLASETTSVDYGINSIDEFAFGETHDMEANPLPLYNDVNGEINGGAFSFTVLGQLFGGAFNTIEGVRFLTFEGDGQPITITADNSASAVGSLGLQVYGGGQAVGDDFPDTSIDDTSVTVNTVDGTLYVVVVLNLSTSASTTNITIGN